MAAVEVMGPPNPSSDYPRGLKSIDNNNQSSFGPDTLYQSTDTGTRTSVPVSHAHNLSSDQFGSMSTPDYSGPRSMMPGGFGSMKPPIDRSPKSMTTSMHPGGGAATGNNSVPSFAPTQGTKLTASQAVAKAASKKGPFATVRRIKRALFPGASPHAGKNAEHLRKITKSA